MSTAKQLGAQRKIAVGWRVIHSVAVTCSGAGGIRLDTMFVDEGFGSLSDEHLWQAIKALSGLTEANRLVGIISHVADLKDKIDRQVVVTKDRCSGSRVEIVT